MNGLKLLIATPAYIWGSAFIATKVVVSGICSGQSAGETFKQCKAECEEYSYRLVKLFRVD